MKIHLTNWGSKTKGPGKVWSIMAVPREWEYGDGSVPALRPRKEAVLAAHAGTLSREEYRARFLDPRLSGVYMLGEFELSMRPGEMIAFPEGSLLEHVLVQDGDSLCCACGRKKAAQNRCHRTLSAALLTKFGWEVYLDGEPFPSNMVDPVLAGRPFSDGRLEHGQSILDWIAEEDP